MGGLLSAYALTCDRWLLDTAAVLAERVLPAFGDDRTGHLLPKLYVDRRSERTVLGGYLLEFVYLSSVIGANALHYARPVRAMLAILEHAQPFQSIAADVVRLKGSKKWDGQRK